MNAESKKNSPRQTRPKRACPEPSPEASRRAVAILEVLAGQRTAVEAAEALSISVNHYYQLERKALRGLTAACESQRKGPKGPELETRLQALQRKLEKCERECMRQTALVRAAQRAVGLSSIPEPAKASRKKAPSKGGSGKKRRRRSPKVRALRAAQVERKNSSRQKSEVALKHASSTPCPPASVAAVSSYSPSTKEHHDGASGEKTACDGTR